MVNSYTDANGVYRNKLGITDAAQLKAVEYEITKRRSVQILKQNALGEAQGFNLARQQAIHQHLFQDVYEWAGKTRTVPSSKGLGNGMVSVFANPDSFEISWRALEQKTSAFASAKEWSFEQKRAALVEIFIEANRIHPFPEGNGRSLQVFMKELARTQSVALDYSKVNAKEWNMASAVSGLHGQLFERKYLIPHPANPDPIKKIFEGMASPSLEFEIANSLKEIGGIVSKLRAQPLPGGLSAVVQHADPQARKPYSGKVVALTEHHALQQVGANKFIIHERGKSATQELSVGKCVAIAYGQNQNVPAMPARGKDKGRGLQC